MSSTSGAIGSANPNSAPASSRDRAQIRPPSRCTILRQAASPIPTPPAVERAVSPLERLEQAGGWLLVRPIPRSRTRTGPRPRLPQLRTSIGEPSGLYFAALPTRFSTSSSRWVRSASTITDGRLLKAIEWSG